MRLLCVRHGQTYFNELNLTQGWCDSPLSEKGILQARMLSGLVKDLPIDRAYASTSERAYDTLAIVLDRPIVIKRDKRLKELNFGYFEGQPNGLKDKIVSEDFNDMIHSFDYRPYHGECLRDVIAREKDFLAEVVHEGDETIVIGGHGLSLTALLHALCEEQLKSEYPAFRILRNASAVLLDYHSGQYQIERFID